PPPGPPLVRVARPPRLVVPRGGSPVAHQPILVPAPRPRLGHRERPEAQVEGAHARPHEPDLLLACPDHLLTVLERPLQAEPLGHHGELRRRRSRPGRCRSRRPTRAARPPGPPGSDHRTAATWLRTSCTA